MAVKNNAFLLKLKDVPVAYADVPGRNRNVYSYQTMQEAINWWKNATQLDPTYKYMLIKHPMDEKEESLTLVAGIIDDLKLDDKTKTLMADMSILSTTWGELLAYLIKNDLPVGLSIRGIATPVPRTMEYQGKRIDVVDRTDLKLEGIDFVLYPSFITTQIKSSNIAEHNNNKLNVVLESFIKSNSLNENDKKILDLIMNSTNNDGGENIITKENINNIKNDNNIGGISMENKIENKIEDFLLKERIEKDILNNQNKTLESNVASFILDKNNLLNEISILKSKKDSMVGEIKEVLENFEKECNSLSSVKEKIKLSTTEIENLQKQINEKKEELKKADDDLKLINQKIYEAESDVIVRKNGKVFDKDNPPKIRVVPASERISRATWGNVNKDEIRKLAYLSGDKSTINQLFGFVDSSESGSGWNQLKYPIYQLVPSDSNSYDFDALLNPAGLSAALTYAQGRGLVNLSPQDKKNVFSFLRKKYKELIDAGAVDKLPDALANESRYVLKTNNDILDLLLDKLMENGKIKLDKIKHKNGKKEIQTKEQKSDEQLEDEIIEIELQNDTNKLMEKVENLICNSLFGITEEIKEQEINGDNFKDMLSDFIKKLVYNSDGTQSRFADDYDLEDNESVYAFFGLLRDNLVNGDPSTAMQMIRRITSHYLMNSDLADISDFTNGINIVMNIIEYIVTNYDDLKDIFLSLNIFNEEEDNNQPEAQPEEQPLMQEPQQPEMLTEIPDNTTENRNKKSNKSINNTKNVIKNKKTIESVSNNKKTNINNNEGDDMKEMDDVIKLIAENFEFDEKITEQNIKDVLSFIIKDYADKIAELDMVKFEKVLTEKKMQLKNAGLEDEIIQEAFSNLKTIEEIEKETNRLLKLTNSITESRTKKQVVTRKGKMDVSNTVEPDDNTQSLFERMLNII